ncbi:RNA-binding S4 domain-containing protein [Pedobacter sp. KBS0701]|uniref:RNA-binding S4 domain-containing protein n=1 Tax=Pedobacter sp. KBS0701 TaxID=2578106 RepID=UPI00110E68BF|nr:RNA-binding S4 domain-containing protein [Pedobacter sp. KBS0701]QDW24272.1 RNA-binding S4 domain-containing protein [Pedobacter sp. KBS0701]
MIQFKLEGEFIPLIQLLKANGLVGSGGDAQTVVEDGLVKTNGEVEFRKRYKVRVGDIITFGENKIEII